MLIFIDGFNFLQFYFTISYNCCSFLSIFLDAPPVSDLSLPKINFNLSVLVKATILLQSVKKHHRLQQTYYLVHNHQ